MKSQLIVAAGLALAFGGTAFAQEVPPSNPPVEEPAPMDDAAPPPAAEPEAAPPEAAPPEAGQAEVGGAHSTTVHHGPHKNPRKQSGRAGEPGVIDHSYDTAPVPNPTISSFTIVPPPA